MRAAKIVRSAFTPWVISIHVNRCRFDALFYMVCLPPLALRHLGVGETTNACTFTLSFAERSLVDSLDVLGMSVDRRRIEVIESFE